jgi:hypothetical protein
MTGSIPVPVAAGQSLVFNWDSPRRRNLAIAGFLAISLVGHAACFYIFQVVYPPTAALLPPPARVSLITADSEDGRTLLRWVEAEDPALAFTTRRPPNAGGYVLPRLEHIPSYFATQPALKQAPPLAVDLRMPVSQPPGAVPVLRRPPPPAFHVIPTSVIFSNEITALGAPALPPRKFAASSKEEPENIRFRIGINSRGEVRYCFPLDSSGDPALDQQARTYLGLCRFPPKPATESLTWGIAGVEWGNDVARPKPAPTAKPVP